MKRDDPQILKLYGLTAEEAADPGTAVLSAGVRKIFDVCRFMALPVDLGENGMGKSDAAIAQAAQQVPLWQSMTGLFPGTEKTMPPETREEAVENLVEIVLRLLRYEMKLESEKPNLYHTMHWDPLQKICIRLGIARAELSRLAKEATGLAAHELVDVVRVKGVKEKMKEHVRVFLRALRIENCKFQSANLNSDAVVGALSPDKLDSSGLRAPTTEPVAPTTRPTTALQVWALLKEARRGPQFHRGQWAQHLGFPNYARFYRACLVFHQLAPQQLELMAIEEVLEEIKNEKSEMKKAGEAEIDPVDAVAVEKERMARVVWEELKRRHVQFFAGMGGKVWAEAS